MLSETGAAVENPVRRTALAGALTVLNLGMRAVVQLAVMAMCVRFLGREGAGLWVLLQAISLYFALSDMGVGQTMINVVGRHFALGDREGMRSAFTTTFVLHWLIVVPVGILFLLLMRVYPIEAWLLPGTAEATLQQFRTALFIIVPLTLVRVPLTIFSLALLAVRQMHIRQLYEIVLSLGTLLATALALLAGGGFVSAVVAFQVAVLVINVSVAFLLPRYDMGALRFDRASFRGDELWPLFSNSLYFLILGLTLFVDQSAGNVLVGKLGTVADVPVMFVMLTLLRVFGTALVNALSAVLQPYVIMLDARNQHERIVFFGSMATKASVFVATMIVATVWLLGSDLTALWVGRGLAPPRIPVALLGLAFVCESIFSATSNFLVAMNRHRSLAGTQALKTVLSLTLATLGGVLFPDRIFLGISLGLLLASLLVSVSVLPAVTRLGLELTWRRYLEGFIARPALLILVAAALLALSAAVPSAGVALRSAWLVASFAILGGFAWMAVLTSEETAWLLSALGRVKGWRRAHE